MKYDRIYNFSAGPSMLPLEVLESAKDNLINYEGSGMSVMEMSHRSKVYDEIITQAERKMREVMNIPDNYKVIFMQGATLQFAMVPMNLMVKNGKADYIVTGYFSDKAAKEAAKYGKVNVAASTEKKAFAVFPVNMNWNWIKTRIMCIYVLIIQSMAPVGTTYPIREMFRWWRTCLRAL